MGPETDAPVAQPTMSVENIDLDQLRFIDAEASVAYNETGEPLSWTALEDGKQILHRPRVQKREGTVRVSLDDLASCLEGWVLTADSNNVVLEAAGHTLALLNEDAGIAASVDGIETPVAEGDFDFGDGHFISPGFLAGALGGKAVWDEEENTLILRIPEGT